jgi:hypothetical protein
MRRGYPTSFCFQVVIEIILEGFFTASRYKGVPPVKLHAVLWALKLE